MNKLNVVLLLLALFSGLLAVTVQDRSRQHYIALDKAQKQKIALDQDYARLKLEQARLSNHKLIQAAAEAQNLHPPSAENTQIVEVK